MPLLQVDKLLGPGNQYVTAAKMLLQNSEAMVSIDMPAGPSEVLVIADKHASAAFVAADLLSQAEHGPDSQVRVCLLPLIQGLSQRDCPATHMHIVGPRILGESTVLCCSQCALLRRSTSPKAPVEAI